MIDDLLYVDLDDDFDEIADTIAADPELDLNLSDPGLSDWV